MRSTPSGSTERPRRGLPSAARPSGWLRVEVDRAALRHNLAQFRRRIGPPARLLAVVKANAYGHHLLIAARAFLAGGADMLGVHSVAEARVLRRAGVRAPVLVLGPATEAEAAEARDLGVEITVGSLAAAAAARRAAAAGADLRVHLKVETGVHRQGVAPEELDAALALLAGTPGLALAGLSSHFADIEDTTDHAFARAQDARFAAARELLTARGHVDVCCHMSCSASAILWERSHRDLVRVGIAAYGIWPSRETLVSARETGRGDLDLRRAATWKCDVSQVKTVPAGETVGYGRTWKAPAETRLAVLPLGYADGYPRDLGNRAHVLVGGRRAPLRGRVCMNLCMADVTHVPGAAAGDEAVLLGRQQEEEIRAEQLADLLHTIPYEVLTLPGPTWEWVEA